MNYCLAMLLCCCLPFLTACGSKASSDATTAATASSGQAELVDIGGRKLQILARGRGSPTIVIEAGMGEPGVASGSWAAVVDEISQSHRVVLYDRAGLGGSDPAPKLPRTSRDVASDLQALLVKAAVPGPYLLVGHSYGGLHIRMFASQFPEKVAGMVLVDATHPDQDQRWLASFGPASDRDSGAIRKVREFLGSRTTPSSNPERIDPKASSAEVRAARGLGAKPLVILQHSAKFRLDPSLPEDVSLKLETVAQELQAEFKQLSSNSTLRQSLHGGHNLHVEDPGLVIAGIRSALEQAKAKD